MENNERGESAAKANEKQNQSIQNHNQNQDSPLNPPDGGNAELNLVHSPQPETSSEAEFEAFWVAYPRRVGRKAAKSKFLAILKRGEATTAQLIAGARAYADEMRREGRPLDKIAHPTTWLNNARWEDEYEVTRGGDPTVDMTPEQLERYRRIIEERQRG